MTSTCVVLIRHAAQCPLFISTETNAIFLLLLFPFFYHLESGQPRILKRIAALSIFENLDIILPLFDKE